MNAGRAVTFFLLLLGAGFLVANTRLLLEYLRYRRRRPGALLVWQAPKPPNYGMSLGIGVVLGLLVFFKLVYVRAQAYGETMMFIYYGYLLPLSTRIARGLYANGVWTDSGFMAYADIGGLSWKAGTESTLVLASRVRAWTSAGSAAESSTVAPVRMTPSGVRSSCDTVIRNSSLSALARSAAVRACCASV